MAAEQRVLKPDGFLDVPMHSGTSNAVARADVECVPEGKEVETRGIVYHPNLNVILVFDSLNRVKVLDVHSGVVLQTYHLGNDTNNKVYGFFMPLQEKILITDGHVIGFRGDYNGVLLLDTVLQTPVSHNDDTIRLELLLSEAILFQTCLKELEQDMELPYDLQNELLDKIKNAQGTAKKGIKAQRWNTICLHVSYSSLKLVANNLVTMLKKLERHVPALAIASAINERLIDLLAGSRMSDKSWQCNNFQRVLMHSEAVRRQTFEKWPHMDYKWALPDQMAQAGFYHQPSSSGEDRAMCFTCNVCLVCWEKTDEPWSEHERHSPMCPFVKGEYTQNVPLAVTYATNPAISVEGVLGFDVISNSDYANVLCTSCSQTGEVTIYSIERHLKQMHSFNIASIMSAVLEQQSGKSSANSGQDLGYEWSRVTAICVLPNLRAQSKIYAMSITQSGPSIVASTTGNMSQSSITPCTSTSTMKAGVIGSKIILGISTGMSNGDHLLSLVSLNIIESELANDNRNKADLVSESSTGNTDTSKSPMQSIKAVSGDGGSTNEAQTGKAYQDERDHKNSHSNIFEKYADGFDSNGFASDIVAPAKNEPMAGSGASGDKPDSPMEYNEAYLAAEFKKMAEQFGDLNSIFDYDYGQSADTNSITGAGANAPSGNADDIQMDTCYFKDNLLAAAKNAQKAKHFSSPDCVKSVNTMSSEACASISKVTVNEEIDCILESCVIIQCINTPDAKNKALVEVTDIIPTNSSCNQLLLKLCNRSSHDAANDPTDGDSEQNAGTMNASSNDDIGGKLILFDFKNGVLSSEYRASLTFKRDNYPVQVCMLPTVQSISMICGTSEIACGDVASGGGCFSVVFTDGSIKIYSLQDFQQVSSIREEGHNFISVAYCRSLERLCCCTRKGSLIFYSLNDADSESGDEMGDMEEEACPKGIYMDRSVTDGVPVKNSANISDGDPAQPAGSTETQHDPHNENIKIGGIHVDCAASSPLNASQGQQSSPSPSQMSINAGHSNLLAYKESDLSLDDLRELYTLTRFDDKNVSYTAEVPSCWNNIVHNQKQRKQSPHNWRLHNDATTWDEHIIEINLLQAAALGHIDLKFSLYQQCHNPAAIQVTLLKQNTSGFGYRMKRPHSTFKNLTTDPEGATELPSCSSEANQENPVLNEEFLQTHNAEILAGPIEISSCIDLCDQGGTVILTSPKLFKTRARNLLLHIKTMGDPIKEGQSKTRGCDWLHEISIYVRGVKSQPHIPNERLQRIAMLESNLLLENLLKIISSDISTELSRNYALDILIWICCVRLKRFRCPKSDRNRGQSILAQQVECIGLSEKYLEETLRNCMIHSNRSMAHKCVKLMIILTDGFCNLPSTSKSVSKLDVALRMAIAATFNELPLSKHASVVRWYIMLACITSTNKTYNSISEMGVKLLLEISDEIKNRFDPYGALIATRFGLYGFPFEPDIFDYDLPNVNKNNVNLSSTLMNIIRNNAGIVQAAGIDIKKLCSIDGVDFRTFPHLIKCKSVSNQLRGLLEVEQLHYTCASTSEATRIDSMDSMAGSASSANVNLDDLLIAPMVAENMDQIYTDKMNDILNNVKNNANNTVDKVKTVGKMEGGQDLKPNGIGPPEAAESAGYNIGNGKSAAEDNCMSTKVGGNSFPKFKFICEYIDQQLGTPAKSPQSERSERTANVCTDNMGDRTQTANNVFAWHRLLSPPPKQMIVIDRMHSGARRFVVLDFGSPVLLTDLIIPACDELASLHIDLWCFDEETDCIRLVRASDIGTKTLVLSDIQPPPICRYLKITIVGRIGMSSTKCKIPLGSFFGHVVVLESDGYGDVFINSAAQQQPGIESQLKALRSLHEDVHCRYSLASCKLLELLTPLLNSDVSNIAHMQAFINKQRIEDDNTATVAESGKITSIYEECIVLQHELNVIRNVIQRLELSVGAGKNKKCVSVTTSQALKMASRDKLRVLGQALIELLLNFSIEYNLKDMMVMQQFFTEEVASMLFNSFVVYGDAHIQLATCSLLVRMCCVQNWWGDFLANIFCTLFSSQNSNIFPQDRIFFLLTYLGRRSISMGNCRSIVIDAILKTLAIQLAPISNRYRDAAMSGPNGCDGESAAGGVYAKSDLQLVTWLLLFLSVCLDDRKDKSTNRWDFMSCETDFAKTRGQSCNSSGKQLRCFKKRIIQQNKYSVQPYTDWGKKIYMIQNEHPGIFMELSGKPKSSNKGTKANTLPKAAKEGGQETDNNFDKGLKNIRLNNVLIVIRGLIALLLEMDFTCNMDQFLLTCKVIARLVSACRPAVQLSKIITINQLEHLIRMAVWNDQHQPWAVHAITCLVQDLLDADRHYKDNDATPTNDSQRSMEGFQESIKDLFADYTSLYMSPGIGVNQPGASESTYGDGVKYPYLPSLIECEDTEFDEILNDIDIIERNKNVAKKDSSNLNKNTVNYFCKSISSAMDSRLDIGLDLNVETDLRRITMVSSLDMYSSLPQIATGEFKTTSPEVAAWPDYVADLWSGPEYNYGFNTYTMFKNVFDCILADLHLEETWVHLEQVLQMWLTLNGELADKPLSSGAGSVETPKIPFGANAVQGLLLALAWYNDVKLRTWCLGFQCLLLACNSQTFGEEDADRTRINEVIVNDENFEKMLLRFFSGYGMSSVIITNRCAGPTICKHLHELLIWLHRKGETADGVISCKRKVKDTLLHVILQLVQPGGAISNQLGPIDAQSQLVRDLLTMPNDQADLNISLNIIECVSFLVFNNVSNGDKVQCQRTSDTNNTGNSFSSLFANVLGSDHTKQNSPISDNSLIISLLRLCSSLIQTELPRQLSDVTIPEEEELTSICQTDETKAEQLNIDGHRVKTPCIADTVLRHFATMKRLLGSLSHCSSSSFTLMASSDLYGTKPAISTYLLDEPQTSADAVFNMLLSLCDKASNPRLIVAPICQYLKACTTPRSPLPRLHLSEPLLWFISKVLNASTAVQIFTQLGGIEIVCKNLVMLNKILLNVQPGLISMVMQHMTRNAKLKLVSQTCGNGNGKKSSSNSSPNHRYLQEGLINFAPFCTISAENDTAQSADILIINPVASHRRPRTPAWSYMFYPNESHADLTITLPTAILLREVQLQPHAPTLASCPSAVALEISRDFGMGPVPVGPPLTTTGMTCIRLKLSKPEIATSIVLRLYRPKDSPSIGLTQIAVLGNSIFASPASNPVMGGPSSSSTSSSCFDMALDDDSFAKTSVGWVRILSRCYNAASKVPADSKLAADVIGASAAYPGFLDACCSLMNIMPMIPNATVKNLETVLLRLGSYSRELCLTLIRTLLWGTRPQIYKLSNECICDLLYDLCTAKDEFVMDKVKVLLEWIDKLRQNYSSGAMRCNNPQSGFIKCISSILWCISEEGTVPALSEHITPNIFEACMHWIDRLGSDEPLKVAFDTLLCSLCFIQPNFFNILLLRVNVKMAQIATNTESTSASSGGPKTGLTDDNKEQSGRIWFLSVASDNLSTLFLKPSYLATIAYASQSPNVVFQLVDSGLPKLLAYALYEYCRALLARGDSDGAPLKEPMHLSHSASTAQGIPPPYPRCMTDADKVVDAVEEMHTEGIDEPSQPPLMTFDLVPKILDFFTECCAEGHMRDWLGTQQGTIFWKPLLKLLCDHRPTDILSDVPLCNNEPTQQTYIRIERATINFFGRVTSCHPNNQNILTAMLIEVIRESSATPKAHGDGSKHTISGFTRQLVLQLLLENERILVSVRSKQPLQKKDLHTAYIPTAATANLAGLCNNCASPNSVSIALVNHHPARRISKHHLLFSVSVNAKCQDIIQNSLTDVRRNDGQAGSLLSGANMANNSGVCDLLKCDEAEKNSNDTYKDISINFTGLENGMEFLSVAAGVTAKDKRIKEVKNQVAASKECKEMVSNLSKFMNLEDILPPSTSPSSFAGCVQLVHRDYPDVLIGNDTTVSQLLAALANSGYPLSKLCLSLEIVATKSSSSDGPDDPQQVKASLAEQLPSPLQRFSSRGGLSLLAQFLPTVYPEVTTRKHQNSVPEKEKSPPMNDWVKLEPNDDIYEDLEDPLAEPAAKQAAVTTVPQHSLAAFGLFLRLPAYSDVLLRDKLRAQCLLRLVLGVTGDGEGNDIYSLPLAPTLPTLPFEVFRRLLECSPLSTDDGVLLRRMVIEVGAMHLILNCLSVFTHHSPVYPLTVSNTEAAGNGVRQPLNMIEDPSIGTSDDKGHMYWAKGTGFGTGSTTQSWNVEQALLRQKSEEEHVTVLLQVLASYINPEDRVQPLSKAGSKAERGVSSELPVEFLPLLKQSCLIPALSSYLRNDSVLDITRHIPLYRAILHLLRSISLSVELVPLLQPQKDRESSPSISELLANMKKCVDTYAKRLKLNKKSNIKGQTQQVTVNLDDGDDEGLALLIPDIQDTTSLVQMTTKSAAAQERQHLSNEGDGIAVDICHQSQIKSIDERYLEVMKKLQFDTFDMIVEAENNGYRFVVSHHFEKMVRMAGDRYHPSRVKRLAQEAVTLSTSLPLSYSSSVFVRCDTDRLDVMKVLITGPADTPYANGCFEFDVFFPPDYPNLPMLINLETTGRHTVRFNPNLYNDGKVCLSVLNTWHGRPEEKWNAQTSSFLQVLVSIQSLILVPEPYFNEPGFERSRGTPSGTHSSREYNSNIYQACVRWAMLEQIRNPSPCFKDVIHTHFWLKRTEICTQIEAWIEELCKPQYNERSSRTISFNSMVLRRQYRHLREELAKLKVPAGLEDLDAPFNPNVTLPTMGDNATSSTVSNAPTVAVAGSSDKLFNQAATSETKSATMDQETLDDHLNAALRDIVLLTPLQINTSPSYLAGSVGHETPTVPSQCEPVSPVSAVTTVAAGETDALANAPTSSDPESNSAGVQGEESPCDSQGSAMHCED